MRRLLTHGDASVPSQCSVAIVGGPWLPALSGDRSSQSFVSWHSEGERNPFTSQNISVGETDWARYQCAPISLGCEDVTEIAHHGTRLHTLERLRNMYLRTTCGNFWMYIRVIIGWQWNGGWCWLIVSDDSWEWLVPFHNGKDFIESGVLLRDANKKHGFS